MSDLGSTQDPKPLYRSAPAASARPDRTLPAIMLLAVASLAGMLALLPGSEEKAEGLFAEGRYADAIQTLVTAGDDRPLNGYEGHMLFKLYMLTEQPDSAAQLLAEHPALQADSADALRQLSDLYRQMGDIRGEAAALRQLYGTSPNNADFARLRVLYRLTGDTSSEASLLSQAISNGRSDQVSLERLAYLQTLSPTGVRAALWVSPSGRFSHFETIPGPQIIALADHSAPAASSTTSLE